MASGSSVTEAAASAKEKLAQAGDALPTPESTAASKQVNPIKDFIAGGFGGVCCVLTGHPFDLTKVRLQTAAPGTYTGALDVVRKTIAKDGPTGAFGTKAHKIPNCTGYAQGKKLVYAFTPQRTSKELSFGELAVAGGFSAIPMTAVTAPMERVKVVLQTQGDKPQYKGPTDVVRKLYAEGGIRSLFRGTFATLARDVPGSAIYFVAYEGMKRQLAVEGQEAGFLSILLAGGVAGMAMWSIAIPPDTVKSRLQSAPQGTYTGFLDCARQLIAKDGAGALMKGAGPAIARAFPANAATFLGYEMAMKLLNNVA